MKTYRVNEIFHSLQGEGLMAGRPTTFVRFARCNLECSMEAGEKSPGGFDCDTEFISGRDMTAEEITCEVLKNPAQYCVFTGGEPLLQLDENLYGQVLEGGGVDQIGIETNGTFPVPFEYGPACHVVVSPKVAWHALKINYCNELRLVRSVTQVLPRIQDLPIAADSYFCSPASWGMNLDPETVAWCIDLVMRTPPWRLSTQQHKVWGMR